MNSRSDPSIFSYILIDIASIGALLAIYLLPNLYAFLSSLLVWFCCFGWIFIKKQKNYKSFVIALNTSVSFVALLLLVESVSLQWIFIMASGFVFPLLLKWSYIHGKGIINFSHKPLRRIIMMIHVFNVYAWLTALFAVAVYFSEFPFWVLSIIGALFTSFVTYIIWDLYFPIQIKKILLWIIILGLVIMELMWVMNLFPFGYLACGLLVVWLWYIFHLLVRFHLSPKGIIVFDVVTKQHFMSAEKWENTYKSKKFKIVFESEGKYATPVDNKIVMQALNLCR